MTTSAAPTVFLVHGAFADASGFGGVIRELQTAGRSVVAPPNQLRSLAFDAAAIATHVAAIDGPVVLVGHSYGGAVITQASGLMALNDVDPSVDNEQFKAQRSQGIPLGRLATTDEVADAALFLASGISSFTTGAACPSTAATTRSKTARKAS